MTENEPSGAQKMFGEFAPKLAQLTDDVLFGDVWERHELSPRDRSLSPCLPGALVPAVPARGSVERGEALSALTGQGLEH